jgi:hypothetical protein
MITWINNKKINTMNFELLSKFCILNTSAIYLHTYETTATHSDYILDIHSCGSIMWNKGCYFKLFYDCNSVNYNMSNEKVSHPATQKHCCENPKPQIYNISVYNLSIPSQFSWMSVNEQLQLPHALCNGPP